MLAGGIAAASLGERRRDGGLGRSRAASTPSISQVPSPITGLPALSASAISDSVP